MADTGEAARIGVLVVEDEEAIRQGLCDVLAYHGHQPEGVERGDEGLRRGLAGEHALVILDVMLPGLDGFEVCRALREARPALPILMLTARGSEEDVLQGFRLGADDYVTKPFSVAELMARVGALLRRAGSASPGSEGSALRFGPLRFGPFRFGEWEVDPAALRAGREGRDVELTRRELELLALFAKQRGRIVSRRFLLRELWGYPDPDRVETRTVDMHIAKLRKKLEAGGDRLIETVRGEGYRFSG